MQLTCYIDESGNTRDLYWNVDGPNFKDQPYFSLGLTGIPNKRIPELETTYLDLKRKYHIQSPEPKGKDVYNTDIDFVIELIQYLLDNDAIIKCEITEKNFFLVTQITDFLLNVLMNDEEISLEKRKYALAFYKIFNNDTYIQFCNLCRNRTEENYFNFLNHLKGLISEEKVKDTPYFYIYELFDRFIFDMINEKQSFKIYVSYLPIPDMNKRNKSLSSLPNIPSLANLIMRTNFTIKNENPNITVKYIHDEDKHIDEILKSNVNLLLRNDINKQKEFCRIKKINTDFDDIDLSFEISKNMIGLQVVDIVLSAITNSFFDFINQRECKNNLYYKSKIILDSKVYKILENINFVVPDELSESYSSFLYSQTLKRYKL